MAKKLHPSVEKFKNFVKANPKLILEVRKGKSSWQELYEEWYLLGEEDSRWDSFRSEELAETKSTKEEKKNDWVTNVFSAVKKMDTNQVQQHLQSISQALAAIQGVIGQFQGSKSEPTVPPKNEAPRSPFSFRKD